MSIQERPVEHRPACDWTDAEWKAHQQRVDAARVERGEPPLDWRGVRKPRRVSPSAIAHLRSLQRTHE